MNELQESLDQAFAVFDDCATPKAMAYKLESMGIKGARCSSQCPLSNYARAALRLSLGSVVLTGVTTVRVEINFPRAEAEYLMSEVVSDFRWSFDNGDYPFLER